MFLMTLYCICVACKLSSCSQLLITCTEYSSRFRLDVQVQQVNHYTFNGLSQGLSPLPPLPASHPTHDEPNDRDVDAAAADDQPAAPQDTDLELSERNILAGKRNVQSPTVLLMTVEGTSAGPSKKLSRHGVPGS
ncbi:hypothetical protein B0H14DRAFT_101854 [Mycena olivaceomarginata]|nr:hypothetical protein B0H14DRAFT_101854 [Mycena olivaceomarginata]